MLEEYKWVKLTNENPTNIKKVKNYSVSTTSINTSIIVFRNTKLPSQGKKKDRNGRNG